MIAGCRPSPCSMPVGCMKIEKVQTSQAPRSIMSAMSSSVARRAVLDRGHALLHGEAEPEAAVGVGRRVLADALGLLDGGADLLAGVDARLQAWCRAS